jgi:hypothetical protein
MHARLKTHMRDRIRRDTPLYRWVNKLVSLGLMPSVSLILYCDDARWEHAERAAIAIARGHGVKLLNVADGGDQPFCPKSVRAENGREVSRRRTADPLKARIYRLKRDMNSALRRGDVPDEAKENLRRAAMVAPQVFGEWANV